MYTVLAVKLLEPISSVVEKHTAIVLVAQQLVVYTGLALAFNVLVIYSCTSQYLLIEATITFFLIIHIDDRQV